MLTIQEEKPRWTLDIQKFKREQYGVQQNSTGFLNFDASCLVPLGIGLIRLLAAVAHSGEEGGGYKGGVVSPLFLKL